MIKINLRNLKKEAKKLDINKMDVDSFWESLLLSGPVIKQFCKRIDEDLSTVASFDYSISYANPLTQYDRIVEDMCIKGQLMKLYDVFVDWFRKLSDEEKECCRTHVVKRFEKINGSVMGRPVKQLVKGRRKAMTRLIHSFKDQVKKAFNLDERELVRNPYIYKLYTKIMYIKDRNYVYEGVYGYDDSANEKCYS